MEKQQILARTLAVIVVIASVIPLTAGEEKVTACCTKYSRDIVNDAIIGFKQQKQSLPCVKAIILRTERGTFCIDRTAPWVREKIRQFRAQNKQASTHVVNNMTPTPTSSSISDFTHVEGSTQSNV